MKKIYKTIKGLLDFVLPVAMRGFQSANFKCKHNLKVKYSVQNKNNHHPIERRDFRSACSMIFGIKRPVDFHFSLEI